MRLLVIAILLATYQLAHANIIYVCPVGEPCKPVIILEKTI